MRRYWMVLGILISLTACTGQKENSENNEAKKDINLLFPNLRLEPDMNFRSEVEITRKNRKNKGQYLVRVPCLVDRDKSQTLPRKLLPQQELVKHSHH